MYTIHITDANPNVHDGTIIMQPCSYPDMEEPDEQVDSTQSENIHEEQMIISDLHVPFSDLYELKVI